MIKILSVIVEILDDIVEGSDYMEINIYWPELGVMHFKMRSAGLTKLFRAGSGIK